MPKAREVFHCRESIHHHPKKMWNSCHFARRLGVEEAVIQLRSNQRKVCYKIQFYLKKKISSLIEKTTLKFFYLLKKNKAYSFLISYNL